MTLSTAFAIVWTARSVNAKTGPIPVSTTSKDSCPADCAFQGQGCYAESGPLGFIWKGATNAGPNATFKNGNGTVATRDWDYLCKQVRSLLPTQLWRHNQAGDLPHVGGKVDRVALEQLATANKGKRGFTYTHHNVLQDSDNRETVRRANEAGFTINLSGNNLAHADALADLGVAPVVCVLPAAVQGNVKIETPRGRRVVVCPATYRDDVSCLSCKLCQKRDRTCIVGFPAHGASKRKADAASAAA